YPMVLSLDSALLTSAGKRRLRWWKLAAAAAAAWQLPRRLRKEGYLLPQDYAQADLRSRPIPHGVHPGAHVVIHADGPAPLTVGFTRPFVGGVHAHLSAQPGYGRGEIEIVDRRVLHQHGVPHGIHARGHCPHDFFPVAYVHVVVHYHDELRIHELT